MISLLFFTIIVHLSGAVGAIYCIWHDEKYLAAYLVMALMTSACKGHLRGWKGGQDD